MRRAPFPVLIGAFAVYSYGATAVSAAWFLRRDFDLALWPSIGWAALLFSPWVVVGLMVWAVLRLMGDRARSMVVLTVLALPVVPLAALAATAVDGAMRGAASPPLVWPRPGGGAPTFSAARWTR